MQKTLRVMAVVVSTAACTSVDQVGLMTLPEANPGALLSQPVPYQPLGSANGRSCRFFALGAIPWGNSTAGDALQRALAATGGNALLNASIETNLYGFIPVYNVFTFSCTTVRGTSIRYEIPAPQARAPY